VDRLVGLIDTCLADDRLESETVELKTELADITPLLQAAINQQRRDHPDREIDLSLHSLPEIRLDMGLLVMSINNLLNNALKYSSRDIHVSASVLGNQIQIEITDHGIGIPSEDLDHIFDRFYRADNVKGMAGTGIGLHMSHRIVTLHGGSIDVISSEGVGSTFTIRLPVASV
jgi:signal transduction histidine kinase